MFELFILIAGMFCGALIMDGYHKSRSTEGVLKVRYDEDEPYLFLELSRDQLSNIQNKETVILKVDITRD